MPRVTIKSGPTFECPSGRTLLEGALAAGIRLPYDCRGGACGHCKCKLVSGSVEMDGFEDRALSDAEADAGIILACRAVITEDITIALRGGVAIPLKRLTGTVVGIEAPVESIRRIRLDVPKMALTFNAGQYAKLGFGDIPPRSYSMANRPDEAPLEFHIRQVSNGRASAYVAQQLKVGESVTIEAPFGTAFFRDDHTGPILAVATGTGLAPILSIIRTALTLDGGRCIFLYVGARDDPDIYAQAELQALVAAHPSISVRFALSRPATPTSHRTGYVQDAIKADSLATDDLMVYIAGSPSMVEATQAVVIGLGIDIERIHVDPFLPAKASPPPQPSRGFFKRLLG